MLRGDGGGGSLNRMSHYAYACCRCVCAYVHAEACWQVAMNTGNANRNNNRMLW